jgi:hypothetical protein
MKGLFDTRSDVCQSYRVVIILGFVAVSLEF